MTHVLFLIWMLGYPVALAMAHRIHYNGFSAGHPEYIRVFGGMLAFMVYTFVGGLLWQA